MKTERPVFNVIFTPEPEGGFTVTVPSIPECVTYGQTFEEASKNVREALLLCIEHRKKEGEEVPMYSSDSIVGSVSFSPEELHA